MSRLLRAYAAVWLVMLAGAACILCITLGLS